MGEGERVQLLIGGRDATQLLERAVWAGDIKNCARTLDVSVPVSAADKLLPTIPSALGTGVTFSAGGEVLFDGFIFSRRRESGGDTVELGCADRGIYLKNCQAAYKFTNVTPEAITQRLAGDFGFTLGEIAQTGVKISRNFPGVSLYKMIQTAYTLAGEQTGEKYAVGFRGSALEVRAKRRGAETPVLAAGSDLINVSVTESTESLISQVAIYDDNGALVSTQCNQKAVELYGLMQAYLKRTKDKDATAEARRLLEENGVSQKITVTNLGSTALRSGGCVVLREAVSGVRGLFWIDSDSHTWEKGLYRNKLVLNFRNIMDEQEAGSM